MEVVLTLQHYFQNIIFYVVSDDEKWVKKNLENSSQNIFYVGAKKKSFVNQETFNATEQLGTIMFFLSNSKQNTCGKILSVLSILFILNALLFAVVFKKPN